MIRRNGIFIQTFIWFWIVMTAVVATLFVIHGMTEISFQESYVRGIVKTPMTYFAQVILDRYEHGDVRGLKDIFNRLKSSTSIETYLFDNSGVEVTGRVAPPEVTHLAAMAGEDDTIAVSRPDKKDIAAMSVYSADNRKYIVVTSIPNVDDFPRLGEIIIFVISFIVVFIISSIACYYLSHRMTKPIVKLKEAARRLASGDLTIRVEPFVGTRRDEIGDLARDFDIMAERVEVLLTSQQQLLGDISHELRSPLSRLGVALQLAENCSSYEARRFLGRIELEVERLNELIGRLLTFVRLESGIENVRKEPFDLAEIVEEVAVDANFEAQSVGKTVRVSESKTCIITGVRELLHGALENVVRNAVRYTKIGTEVEIAFRNVNNGAVPSMIIIVRDHGPGVPQTDLEKIFQPFYRVSKGRERRKGDTGLGLAIARRSIRLHGGSVKAINAPDGGLTVEIIIPHASPDAETDHPPPSPS